MGVQVFTRYFINVDVSLIVFHSMLGYTSGMSGIKIHADEAAVNVNIWIAPDEANLDPTCGGLCIFTAKPPKGWNFEK